MKIVTGCMRSGTSFVCNLLEQLGGNLGDHTDHVPADRWNSKGYYETRDVNFLNNALLFGDWGDPDIWVDEMWPDDKWVRVRKNFTLMMAPYASRKSAIMKRGRQHADEIAKLCEKFDDVIIKDPRYSYVLKEWEKYGKVDKVLYCVRHPWEASYSMSRQTGFPVLFTYMGWNDAIERFFGQDYDCSIEVVNFNNFFEWETAQPEFRRLFAFLGQDYNEEKAKAVFDRVYDPKMRSGVADNKKLPAKTRKLYDMVLSRQTDL